MGDSSFAFQLFLLALLVVVAAIVAFVIAWRVRNRAVRVLVGVLLLAIAAFCGILSVIAALLVAALGVAALVLAARTPRSTSSETQQEQNAK